MACQRVKCLQELGSVIVIAKLRPHHGDGRAVAGLAKLPNSCIVPIDPSLPRDDKLSLVQPSSTAIARNAFVVCMHVAHFHGIEECG